MCYITLSYDGCSSHFVLDFTIICSCLVPLLINAIIKRFNGLDLIVDGMGPWCEGYVLHNDQNDFFIMTVDQYENLDIHRNSFTQAFVILACIFMAMDVAWITMVWVAATVGTPTQPVGRDDYLRKLIIFKFFALNIFPIILLVVGCLKIAEIRQDNYGCGDQPLVAEPPDSGPIYSIFCVLIVTYALELLFFPAIVANKIIRWLRGSRLVRKQRYETEKKGERLEQCLGGCLKCISVMCCNKAGGKELTNQGEMKDFASNLVRECLSVLS